MRSRVQLTVVFGLILSASGHLGCGAKTPPTTRAAAPPVAPESLTWSRAEAVAHLDDSKLAVSAAVQLVRLANVAPLCVPPEFTEAHLRLLRVVRLSVERFALGLADRKQTRCLRAPVLITAQGEVTLLETGVEEELLSLWVSKDADVFPHLAITPERVLVLADRLTKALVLDPAPAVLFALRQERGYSFVALLLADDVGGAEVARYRWDPYEGVFTGPVVDRLPDPPGGKFHLNLDLSELLEPVGGEIAEPEENMPPPRAPDGLVSPEEMEGV